MAYPDASEPYSLQFTNSSTIILLPYSLLPPQLVVAVVAVVAVAVVLPLDEEMAYPDASHSVSSPPLDVSTVLPCLL